MPICIECRHPVKTLWTQYSGAGDQASGHNIRLTVCRQCGSFCDKYVEHDFVVLFIDLVLIKPQVRAASRVTRQRIGRRRSEVTDSTCLDAARSTAIYCTTP